MQRFLVVLLLLPMMAHALSYKDIKEWKLIESEPMRSKLYLGLPYIKNEDKVLLIENTILSESSFPAYNGYNLIRFGFYNTYIYDCKNQTVARKYSVSISNPNDKGTTIDDADLKFHEVGILGRQKKIMDIVCQ